MSVEQKLLRFLCGSVYVNHNQPEHNPETLEISTVPHMLPDSQSRDARPTVRSVRAGEESAFLHYPVRLDMPPQMDYFYHESRVPSDCGLTREDELDPDVISCMLVGDGAVGKTSMIVSYISNGYPAEYQQTGFDVFSGQVQVEGSPVKVQLLDTAGQEEFDEFRALSYAHTDVFLLCFSLVNPTSFHNVTKKWVPEIRAHNPSSPIVLVGTQSDLLLDVNILINLDRSNVKPVLSSRARSIAEKIRAADYIECSSLTQKNLKEAFDAAIFAAIKNKARKSKKRRFSDRRMKAFSRCSWKKFFCFI